ncbi:hypothetical protein [Serratia marcescens]|uniref:hypothetical protein n=1 Tax=Serratia marcescens TaxID=615 RepID=UPI0021C398C2|nr:hypothetical protein [Serratia marcescens]
MPDFIVSIQGEIQVSNPHMPEENFAEKWNRSEQDEGPQRSETFYQWHAAAQTTFNTIAASVGEDNLFLSLEDSFGKAPVDSVRQRLMEQMQSAREQGNLHPDKKTGGLVATGLASTAAQAGVPKNTFYGE